LLSKSLQTRATDIEAVRAKAAFLAKNKDWKFKELILKD